MLSTATELWCPVWFTLPAQIDFWLNHPAVPEKKAAATRAALPTMLPARRADCWLKLYLFLSRARQAGPKPGTAEVAALLAELHESGVVDNAELRDLRPHLLKATVAEFEWHRTRIRAAVLARQSELLYQAHSA
jgi:hypothetical protein